MRAKQGDVIAIALADGTFGFGQITEWTRHSVVLVLYMARSPSAVAVSDLGLPISCVDLTNERIADGDWPIVDHREVEFDSPTYPEGVSHGGPFAASLLDIVHGIAGLSGKESLEWGYEPSLLPNVDPQLLRDGLARAIAATRSRPKSLMGTDALAVCTDQDPRAVVGDEEAAPMGPAELRVTIRYEGDGMPSRTDLKLRHELQRRAAELGEVAEAGAGEGRMDVWIQVSQGQRSAARLKGILEELDVGRRATITFRPIEA